MSNRATQFLAAEPSAEMIDEVKRLAEGAVVESLLQQYRHRESPSGMLQVEAELQKKLSTSVLVDLDERLAMRWDREVFQQAVKQCIADAFNSVAPTFNIKLRVKAEKIQVIIAEKVQTIEKFSRYSVTYSLSEGPTADAFRQLVAKPGWNVAFETAFQAAYRKRVSEALGSDVANHDYHGSLTTNPGEQVFHVESPLPPGEGPENSGTVTLRGLPGFGPPQHADKHEVLQLQHKKVQRAYQKTLQNLKDWPGEADVTPHSVTVKLQKGMEQDGASGNEENRASGTGDIQEPEEVFKEIRENVMKRVYGPP